MTATNGIVNGRPSAPSTAPTLKRTVEGVEGLNRKPKYAWKQEDGLDHNFEGVGELLASVRLQLYRHPEGGLFLVDNGKLHRIASAKELAPLLIDHLRISVSKNGKYHGEKVADSTLNNMLRSKHFLSHFQKVDEVVMSPIVLTDHTPSQYGFNQQGSVLCLGTLLSPADDTSTIQTFLDVMEWEGNADRTNAVAAALTVLFRFHFIGGKPLVLVTASKSHAGKGTVVDFIRGNTAKAEILYENIDWPMEKALQAQLSRHPDIGVINIDNVRIDSSGRGKLIRSGFLESFVTNAEILLNSVGLTAIRRANAFPVLLNTNEGSMSIDLLNRALPIRLAPKGDVTQRKCRIGNPKLEFLPAHRAEIEAELWGMIERWRFAGKPLDESVAHYPMSVWAKTIGGILQVNGFKDFLANYSVTRATADATRQALVILAFHADGLHRRAGELAIIAVQQGLAKVLLSGVDATNQHACERQMGVTLKPYVGETFAATTASERITYLLKKESKRWDGGTPHYRYIFEVVSREAVNEDAVSELVLEDSISNRSTEGSPTESELEQLQPRTLS